MTALWNEAEWEALIAMLGEDDADMVCGLLAEIARLRMALAETEALELQHGAVVARLQARLAACPTVEQLREWAREQGNWDICIAINNATNRMEEANAK